MPDGGALWGDFFPGPGGEIDPHILRNFCCITAMGQLTLTMQKQPWGIVKRLNLFNLEKLGPLDQVRVLRLSLEKRCKSLK